MRRESVSSGSARYPARLLAPRSRSTTSARSVDPGRPPPNHPDRFHPLPPAPSADLVPVGPSLVGTCAATSTPSCNSPTRELAAGPGHWLRSSDSPANTWPGTSPPTASACPGTACPPSPMFDGHTAGIASASIARARSDRHHSGGSETLPAIEAGTDTRGKPARCQTRLRTRSDSADIPPRPPYYRLGLPESSKYPSEFKLNSAIRGSVSAKEIPRNL